MTLQPPIPVLRIFDLALAKAFYVEWLGFRVDWEHRFEPDAPVYLQVARGPVVLHLSGPTATARRARRSSSTPTTWRRSTASSSRPNRNMRPGVDIAPWNAKVLEVIDPFGNRLAFNQPLPAA